MHETSDASGASRVSHATAQPACRVTDVSVAYHADPAIVNVSLAVRQGSVMGVVGPNGAGKSTLLRTMLGLLTPLTGTVEFFGEPLARVRDRVGYMPQSATVDWDFPTTVFDVVLMGTYGRLGMLRRPGKREREQARLALTHVGIEHLERRQIGELSGGQRQRVFLARTLAARPDLLVMDEPFQGVDAKSQESILRVLDTIKRAGGSAIIVHHDLATVQDFCDDVTLINRRVIVSGPVGEVFTAQNIRQTYGVTSSAGTTGAALGDPAVADVASLWEPGNGA